MILSRSTFSCNRSFLANQSIKTSQAQRRSQAEDTSINNERKVDEIFYNSLKIVSDNLILREKFADLKQQV